jgi:hypothetical protein
MTKPTFSDGFDDLARKPEIWLDESRYQMVAADALFDRFEKIKGTGTIEERNGYYKAAMFHAGLAIENAAKAVLVKRDPNLIKNKSINFKNLCGKSGHEILKCAQSALGNISVEEERLLTKLQQYIIWAGKYTLPKFGAVLDDHGLLQEMRLINIKDRMIARELLKQLTAKVNNNE